MAKFDQGIARATLDKDCAMEACNTSLRFGKTSERLRIIIISRRSYRETEIYDCKEHNIEY